MKKRVYPFVEHYLRQYATPEARILDVGCGTSQYRDTVQSEYVGLDITSDPYDDEYLRDVDIVASAMAIPCGRASYDVVFCVAVLYQIPDPSMALREFYRVLKPGGIVLIFDYNRATLKRLAAAEGADRPKWTQWGLKALVRKAGFEQCKLLLPLCSDMPRPIRPARLLLQEMFGTWAIATGVKAGGAG